jgi:hypothetical protein
LFDEGCHEIIGIIFIKKPVGRALNNGDVGRAYLGYPVKYVLNLTTTEQEDRIKRHVITRKKYFARYGVRIVRKGNSLPSHWP